MRSLPRGQGVVEHHPGAAERLAEGDPEPRLRVEAIVVSELHTESIFELMAETANIHTGGRCVSILHAIGFVTKYWHKVFKAVHPERMEDHAGCAYRLRRRTGRVHRRTRAPPP